MNQKIIGLCTSPILALIFRLLLGAIFLYAGLKKACDPLCFVQAIYNYHIIPEWMITPVATLLPWVEIMVGGSLLMGIWTRMGGLVASLLLGIFSCALTITIVRGIDITCGCFGTACSAGPVTWFCLLRDLCLIGMGVHVFLFDQRIASVDRLIQRKLYDETHKKDRGE
ncbi:MAG: DoxX family membrane protein [Deltaproteobacteria bacterium]|nr:DoxX family membrane protein [Deltaproteobacteria bacterium]